jgi:hypothetical protein
MKSVVLGLAIAVSILGAARANTVKETISGTITGPASVDTYGYFGTAGANLSGKTVTVTLQYTTQYFNYVYKCQHYGCTEYISGKSPTVPKSVLIAVTVDSATLTFKPVNIGEVVVSAPGGKNILVESDPGSSNPDAGIFVSVDLTADAKFGGKLSPRLKHNQDFFTIVAPNGQSESPFNFVALHAAH